MTYSFFSDVKNGRLSKAAADQISKCLQFYDGKRVEVKIGVKKTTRSDKQNRYLWGVIYPILKQLFIDEWGETYTIQEVHEWAKLKFNYIEKTNEESGEIIQIPKSTTANSKYQQEEYHEKLRRFSQEWFNCTIPAPNEILSINYND